MRARPKRWIPWTAAALLLGLIAWGFRPQPTAVETARVVEGTLRATINEEGRTRIRQRFVVSAPVAGRLRRIEHKAGAAVQSGRTILAVIEPLAAGLLDARSRATAEARRDVASAQVEKASSARAFARGELQRFQKLFEDKAISLQELEPVRWRDAAAAQELAAAESALRQAKAELEDFSTATDGATHSTRPPIEVLAPAGTRVLRVFEESARVVTAGTPLIEVGDPADLEVVVEVLSRDGATIPPGARVELDQWGGDRLLEAKVRLVEPAAFTKVSALGVEEQRVLVIADLVSPPDQRTGLGDQFRVEARIVVWEAASVLKVPSGALFRRGPAWAAFVVENGRAVERSINAGRSSGSEVQILGGLQKGDQLVLYPGDRVKTGTRVHPIEVSPPPGGTP
jgi:HlyD family secretion protein